MHCRAVALGTSRQNIGFKFNYFPDVDPTRSYSQLTYMHVTLSYVRR